jgi:hypothetical protein
LDNSTSAFSPTITAAAATTRFDRSPTLLVCAIAFVGGGCRLFYWYCIGKLIAGEAHYYREMSELRWDIAEELEAKLGILEGGGVTHQEGLTDELLELLRTCRIAGHEAEHWRTAPPSPERTAAALKWGRLAAEDEAFNAVMDEHTAQEIERGHINEVHFSEEDCEAFRREARAGRRP